MTDQSNMENDIDFVKEFYPQASCDRAFGKNPDRGFYIWTHPCFDAAGEMLPAQKNVDLLGLGQTPELAWKNAVENIKETGPDFK